MIEPPILTRIEQPHDATGMGIEGSDIRALVPITEQARKSQILYCGRPAVFAADDMVDLVQKPCILLVDETILTSPVRSGSHCRAKFI